uniref:Capping protein regulator and myosin 1 linker 3 n=1 Tax=Chelonoidis abingdonii TaxID=106734 RepID=A0A8C0GQN0_CHEAB
NPLLLKVKLETKPKKFEDRVLLSEDPHRPRDTSPTQSSTSTSHQHLDGRGRVWGRALGGRGGRARGPPALMYGCCCLGVFSETYAALCDYNGLCCREEVQWDVDTIYHSADNREFNLLDFSHLESRDLALIVAALAYNPWFTRLHCKDLRLSSEVAEQVLHTLSKSHHLEELVLDNAGLKTDFVLKLTYALGDNPGSALHSLVLSHNQIEDKGMGRGSQPPPLTPFCPLPGLAGLCQTLGANPAFSSSLQHLDLSKNPGLLGGEEANGFYSFLAQPNALVRLELSGTDCAVDVLFGALLHGCCTRLSYLNVSRNTFSHRKAKDSHLSFKQFFSSAYALNHVSLSGTKMPLDALRSLFQGLSANTHLSDVHLDLSGCELRSLGAQVLQEQLLGVTAVGSLDISDNGFDSDLLTLVPALGKNKSLKHLWLGKNFSVKSRTLEDILHKIVQLIQEEDCSLQSLSVSDSRLKSRTSILINALGSNTCLSKVDLSGNSMEDLGAKMLSKALQINSTLRWGITWDRNNTTALGFHDVARALENNYTLKYMSFPMSDITAAYRSAPERTNEVWQKIQWCLVRNGHSQKFSQEQAFRLQQGIGTSSAEQMIRRLCLRVQEEVRALHSCPADTIQEEVLYARELMKEAKNSRALFPSLYELGHILASDGPVRQRLESVANEVSKAVDKELQVILESMVTLTQELCPRAMQAAEGHNKMLGAVSERVTVPRNFIRGALLEQAGQDIQNKLNEVKLSVVTYLTNSIVEELLEELYNTHKILVSPPSVSPAAQLTFPSQSPHSPRLDPRPPMNRPPMPSLAISIPGPQDELLPYHRHLHSGHTESLPSLEGLAELSSEGSLWSTHRGRPAPPLCIPLGSHQNLSHTDPRQENGTVPQLDEGLEEFFSRRVLTDNTSYPWTPRGYGVRPGPSDALPPMQKKRRKGLFHFRRHRSLKGEREVEDTMWGAPHSSPGTPQGTTDEPKAPMRSSASLDEGEEQEPCGMGIPLPGMGGSRGSGVKGLPPRGKQLLQPSRVQGIALPGMGRSLDGKKEVCGLCPQEVRVGFGVLCGITRGANCSDYLSPPTPFPSRPGSCHPAPAPTSQLGSPPPSPAPYRTTWKQKVSVAGGLSPPGGTGSHPAPGHRPSTLSLFPGGSEGGRKAVPLKPQRTRRAQSCDKLESDRGRDPGSRGDTLN